MSVRVIGGWNSKEPIHFQFVERPQILLTFASLGAEDVSAQLVPRDYAPMLPNYQPGSQALPTSQALL